MLTFALLLSLVQDPAAAPSLPPTSQPEAVKLLAAAAAAQYPQHAGRELREFRIDLGLREFGETPHDFGLGLFYATAKGGTLTLQIDDPERGGRVRKGFDGTRHWLQEEDGPILDLSGHEYDQDRERIEEALELSADLLLCLDFASLARRASELQLSTDADGLRHLSGRLRRGEHDWSFTLVLPAKDGSLGPLPSDLLLRQLNPDPATQKEQPLLLERHFAFTDYKRFKERAVPQRVLEYLPDETGVEVVARILELLDLSWEDAVSAPVKGALEIGER